MRGPATRDASRRLVGFTVKQTRQVLLWTRHAIGSADPLEIGVDKNTTVVFPAPLMTTIAELGSFLTREKGAAELS